MIIFTSICANYLPKSIILARSVKRHMPDARFVVCLVEREIHASASGVKEFDQVLLAKDIGFGNFNRFIFQHSIVEGSTAIKAQLFLHLMEIYPEEDNFIYLDPDIVVYSDFIELRERLNEFSIVLCPHLLVPGNVDMEVSSLQHGSYNLGFLAVSRTEETKRFLQWWADRLLWYCYDDIPHGIFTDQKWIDLAPAFFNVYILKHKGYDFATWSLMNSNVSIKGGVYYIEDDPLRFVHFSGYDSKTIDWAIRSWLPNKETNPFLNIYYDYQTALAENKQEDLGKEPWSYDYFYSKSKISKKSRVIFRNNHDIQFTIDDPFLYSNFYIFFRHLRNPTKKLFIQLKNLTKKYYKKIKLMK